ncbi:hypothetical protein ACTXT7_013983 [Hymenolepis weldensis]
MRFTTISFAFINIKKNILIGFEEETNEDCSILDAFESLPPFVSKLKKKEANSQVKKSVSKTLRKNSNDEYNIAENINVDFHEDEVTGDDLILGAFDSMPSFSSILKKKKTTPRVEKPPIICIETQVGEESVAGNKTTLKQCSEFVIATIARQRSHHSL